MFIWSQIYTSKILSNIDIGNNPWNWDIFFSVTNPAMWKDRNELIFRDNWLPFLTSQVQMIVQIWLNLQDTWKKIVMFYTWNGKPLIEGTYKFNADGSHNKVNVQSPCGGLLRDFVELSSKIFTAILAATIL